MVAVIYHVKERRFRCVDEGFVLDIYLDNDISESEFEELKKLCLKFVNSMKRAFSKHTYDEVMVERGKAVSYCEDLCEDDKDCFVKCIENR